MALLGSEESGLGSVETAAGEQPGGGGIEKITSADHSVVVVNPTGPNVDLSTAAAGVAPGSAITGLTFPIIGDTPTLTAGNPVILPAELGVNGLLFADGGLQVSGSTVLGGSAQANDTFDVLGAFHAHVGAPAVFSDTLTANSTVNLNAGVNVAGAPGVFNDGIQATGTNTLDGATEIEALAIDAGDSITVDPAATVTGLTRSVVAGDPEGRVGVATAAAIATITQSIIATWPIANIRFYAVDSVGGSDASPGFSDTSSADAWTKRKQTMAALAAIIPQVGNGRFIVIQVGQGTYATSLTFLSVSGYQQPLIIGTGTNSTAGATAGAGNAADLSYCGAVTATGLNATGYNPTGAATTTSLPCTKVGGGAPGFTADTTTSTLAGFRVRFDAATTTVALRNVSRMIQQVSAVDTVNAGLALPSAPVASDVFYVEQPGVVVPRFAPLINVQNRNGWQIAGFDFGTGAMSVFGNIVPTFCRFKGALALGGGAQLQVTSTIIHPTVAGADTGTGSRWESAISDLGGSSITLDKSYVVSLLFRNSSTRFVDAGCTLGSIISSGRSPGADSGTIGGIIVPAQGQPVRIIGSTTDQTSAGGLIAIDSDLTLGAIVFANQGANPAVALNGQCTLRTFQSQGVAVSGNTGGAGVGLDLTLSRNSKIDISNVTPTVTGSADVKLAGGQTTTWAALAANGLTDTSGNTIVGAAGGPTGAIAFSGGIIVANGSTAVSSYVANSGVGTESGNQVQPNLYPSGFRIFTGLRVTVNPGDSLTVSCTVTLIKTSPSTGSQAATTMQVTIPAGSATGFQVVDLAHPQLFAAGDAYDLRIDTGAGTASTSAGISASLEYAV